MSQWTHVAATFRVDCILGLMPDPDFDDVFGKSCLFDSPGDVWEDRSRHPERYMPCGSEGSLEKSVWRNPDGCSASAFTVSVFGDLRDYDRHQDIRKWFAESCDRAGWIRQAVCVVEVEFKGQYVFMYDSQRQEVIDVEVPA